MPTSGHHRTMIIMNINPISKELQAEVEKLKSRIPEAFSKTIDVDEGWYQIVVDCSKAIDAIYPHYKILQIKQKFGGLRFYLDIHGDATKEQCNEIYKIIRKYEKIAGQTCEATGLPGVPMKSPHGWLKTLNPEYAAASLHYARYEVVNKPPSDEEWSDAIR